MGVCHVATPFLMHVHGVTLPRTYSFTLKAGCMVTSHLLPRDILNFIHIHVGINKLFVRLIYSYTTHRFVWFGVILVSVSACTSLSSKGQ